MYSFLKGASAVLGEVVLGLYVIGSDTISTGFGIIILVIVGIAVVTICLHEFNIEYPNIHIPKTKSGFRYYDDPGKDTAIALNFNKQKHVLEVPSASKNGTEPLFNINERKKLYGQEQRNQQRAIRQERNRERRRNRNKIQK